MRALLGGFKSRLLRRMGITGFSIGTLTKTASRASNAREGGNGRRAGVRPENMVWVFGPGRTGSTWIAAMIEEMSNQSVWFEPRVGDVFNARRFEDLGGHQFILSPRYKKVWLNSMRNFILDGADARFPEAARPDHYLIIKDPAGSAGAHWVMEAMPESRMVLLIRDPRDVAASWLDASSKGGWQNERKKSRRRSVTLAEKNPDAFVGKVARTYHYNVGKAKEAYEAHQGLKALVKYEELRADTLGTMKGMYSSLEIPIDEGELAQTVKKHSWENIPEEKKGEGKFYRKASPGSWREDLTPKQIEIVERETASLLKAFYPA